MRMNTFMKRTLMLSLVITGCLVCFSQNHVDPSNDLMLSVSASSPENTFTDGTNEMEEPQPSANQNESYSASIYSYEDPDANKRVSDSELMKNYVIDRANKIKKRSIIGGSILGGIGIATFLGFYLASASNESLADYSVRENALIGGCIGGAFLIGGGIWIGCAHHKANKMIDSVRYLSLIEHELFTTSNNRMTASIDFVNSNGFNKTNGVSFSLKYSF